MADTAYLMLLTERLIESYLYVLSRGDFVD